MNKKIALVATGIVILFIVFVVVYVNKSMASNGSDGNGTSIALDHVDQSDVEKDINKPNVVIVDLREPFLYEKSHIPNAINIPFADFESRFKELDSNKEIILVCHEGSMGEASGQLLLQNGYKHVSNLTGGMAQWSGPLEK